MKYKNLHDLVASSSSTRKFFLSQPVEMQMTLSSLGETIGSADDLHRRINEIEAYNHAVMLTGVDSIHGSV